MKIEKPVAKKKLPPLPSSFYDLYTSKPASGSSHPETDKNGKVRVLPHVQGQWPTHVYLEWKPDIHWRRLQKLNLAIAAQIDALGEARGGDSSYHSLATSEIGVRLPLHVSLSDTLMPTTASKQQLVDNITTALAGWQGPVAIDLGLAKLRVVVNQQNTRAFVVLSLTSEPIVQLVEAVNGAARRLGLPVLTPQPHVSIAWFLPGHVPAFEKLIRGCEAVEQQLAAVQNGGKVTVDCVKIKCGRDVHSVYCADRT